VLHFDRIEDRFLRDAHTSLAKCLEHVRFRDALEALELNIPNDWQLVDFEDDPDSAARRIFSSYASTNFVEETEREQRLQVAFHLRWVESVSRPSLDVVDDVVLAQTAIADDINILDQPWLGLLSARRRGNYQKSGAYDQAECNEQND